VEPQEYEDRLRQHEEIVQGLARMLAAQYIFNERVTAAIERLEVTQARIETLLARMIPQGENGRDA
jgi:hypothetical protein